MGDLERKNPVQLAFRLFEEGRYQESLELCRSAGREDSDSQTAILAARNLFYLGRLDEAEVNVRDLLSALPGSSYLHSFLGKILEMKGDDAAVAEHIRAVALDPSNQEALRGYAAFLVAQGDFRRAVPVRRKIAALSGRDEDSRDLVRTLTSSGQAREALLVYQSSVRRKEADMDHISALMGAGIYTDAAREALAAHRITGSVDFAQIYLRALGMSNPESALVEYREFFSVLRDPGIGYDYAQLLLSVSRPPDALGVCRELMDDDRAGSHPRIRLLVCRLNALTGEKERALGCFEYLIRESLAGQDDPVFLSEMLAGYREFLLMYYPVKEAVGKFLSAVSGTPSSPCLVSTGRLYEEIGDLAEAQSCYYRAYRADYLGGGIAYARFLARQNDRRECEKVLIYILNNVRRARDLQSVARFILDEELRLYSQPRLLERLTKTLEDHVSTLSSEGLEYLAIAYLISASKALKEREYHGCKESCLRGLDVVPPSASHIHPADFVELIRTCKEQTLSDLQVMQPRTADPGRDERDAAVQAFIDSCDEQERMIIEFMRTHREASEMDLRQLLNTRRVVGIINRIMQKSAAAGLSILVKKGSGQGGEIYAYTS